MMRRLSSISRFLAVALVLLAAGTKGIGFSDAHPAGDQSAHVRHCAHNPDSADRQLPPRGGDHHGDCLSCCFCLGMGAFFVPPDASVSLPRPRVELIARRPATSPLGKRPIAQTHRARAPPSIT